MMWKRKQVIIPDTSVPLRHTKIFARRWKDYPCEYPLFPGTTRITVSGSICLFDSKDVYFIRNSSFRTVWNYLWADGPRQVVHKILSRLGERERNVKCVVLGWGFIGEGSVKRNSRVCFLGPHHPPCATELVVPDSLIVDSPPDLPEEADGVLFLDLRNEEDLDRKFWSVYAGYQVESGLLHRA